MPACFSVILAGKRDSRRHSTRSFGGNVLVLRQQSDQASSNVRSFVIFFDNNNNSANFSGEKKNTMKLSGVSIFWEYANKALS